MKDFPARPADAFISLHPEQACPEKSIRRAFRSDSESIDRLRVTEFRRAGEFELLEPEKLLWNPIDDQHVVLSAWHGSNAVATMRAVVVASPREALARMECSLPDDMHFPAVLFTSAATHAQYRRTGLNQALRYYFFLAAATCGIRTLVSSVFENAPRIGFMTILGYRFMEPRRSWQTKLAPCSRRMLAVLQRADLPTAIDKLQHLKKNVLAQYPWQGPPFRFSVPGYGSISS